MKWISVEDQLPKFGECVDVYTKGCQDFEGRIENCFYDSDGKWWRWSGEGLRDMQKMYLSPLPVTHWMPLPEPPGNESQKAESIPVSEVEKVIDDLVNLKAVSYAEWAASASTGAAGEVAGINAALNKLRQLIKDQQDSKMENGNH